MILCRQQNIIADYNNAQNEAAQTQKKVLQKRLQHLYDFCRKLAFVT
jgi:hypothetical protein